MNVKCPNCRFKFDVAPSDVNENNEVNCTCPRCGNVFVTRYIAPNVPAEPAPVQQPQYIGSEPSLPPQEDEADLYYALMKRMKSGQHDEAGIYLRKLLALKPDEQMYLDIKRQLDSVKQSYLLATKYLKSGELDKAERHVNSLLEVSPNDPMYLSLKEDLAKAQRIEAERVEAERIKKQRKLEEEKTVKQFDGCIIWFLVIVTLIVLVCFISAAS